MAHEMSVAQAVAELVLRTARKEGGTRVARIDLEIGELTFLNPEQVSFWLSEFLKGTEADGAEVSLKTIPACVRCGACGYEGPLAVRDDPLFHEALPVFACPRCRKGSLEILEGRDYMVRSIEIDIPQH